MTLCFDRPRGYGKRSHLALGMRTVIAGGFKRAARGAAAKRGDVWSSAVPPWLGRNAQRSAVNVSTVSALSIVFCHKRDAARHPLNGNIADAPRSPHSSADRDHSRWNRDGFTLHAFVPPSHPCPSVSICGFFPSAATMTDPRLRRQNEGSPYRQFAISGGAANQAWALARSMTSRAAMTSEQMGNTRSRRVMRNRYATL